MPGPCLQGRHINPPALMDLRAALLHLRMNLTPSNCSRDLLEETEEEMLDSSVHGPPGRGPRGPRLPVQGFCLCFSLRSGCSSPGDSYSPFGLQPKCPFLGTAFPDYCPPNGIRAHSGFLSPFKVCNVTSVTAGLSGLQASYREAGAASVHH